jgi:hypothetical protein
MSIFGHRRLSHDRVKQATALERVTVLEVYGGGREWAERKEVET